MRPMMTTNPRRSEWIITRRIRKITMTVVAMTLLVVVPSKKKESRPNNNNNNRRMEDFHHHHRALLVINPLPVREVRSHNSNHRGQRVRALHRNRFSNT